ncbi:MAG: hypothetical protein RL150_594 [Candidatus Parcubacteria bacterium]|jgi:hypothetical protein
MERFLKTTKILYKPLVLSGLVVTILGGLLVVQLLPHLGYAQATTLKVTCAPSKAEVGRDEPVIWRATVRGTESKIAYRWRGVNITTVDKPQVTTSYGSYGTKKATVIVVSNGERAEATCEVDVKADVNLPNLGNQGGSTPQLPQLPQLPGGGNNPLGNLLGGGQQGGQGGVPQAVQNLLGGNSGGSPLGNAGQSQEFEPNEVPINEPEKPEQGGDIIRATGDADGDGKPTSLTEATTECNKETTSGIGGGEGSGLSSNTSQATGEYAVPVDTLTINAYVWELVRKDAGEPGGSSKSYDAADNCVADAMAAAVVESSGNYITTAFGGNPAFVQNLPQALSDLSQMHFESFIDEYKKSQQGSQGDTVVENLMASEYGVPIHEQQKQQEQESKNPWDTLAVRLNPVNSDLLRFLSAQAEIETIQANSINLQLAEYEMNDGYLSKKDQDTGDVEIPGSFIKMVSENRIGLAEQRLVNIDEKGEELLDALQEQLTKPPSKLLPNSSKQSSILGDRT